MLVLLSLLISILPVFLIIGLYYWLVDRQLANGIRVSFWILCIGAFSALPSYIIESNLVSHTFNFNGIIGSVIEAFLYVALLEELFKYCLLYIVHVRKIWLAKPLHYIAAGLIVSIGFALSENILYAFLYPWQTMVVRVFTAVPSHATFGIIMGYYFYRYRKSSKKLYLFLAFFLPFLTHGLYDFFIVQTLNEALLGGALIVLASSLVWNVFIIRSLKIGDGFADALQKDIAVITPIPNDKFQNPEYDPLDKIILDQEP